MLTPASHTGTSKPGTKADQDPHPPRTGRIFDIKRFSTHDGPGIRSTVFLTGCPLRCAWCHNPEAFALDSESSGGKSVRSATVDDLLRELEKDVSYFDSSSGGITISGGEPLFQAAFVFDLLRKCRNHDLHTALDTSGQVDPTHLSEAAGLCDLVLYDLKSMDAATHKEWTGSDNPRILENLSLLDKLDTEVWIRLPLIPGVNDDTRNIDAMIEFLTPTRFRRVSILPYHRIADAKYQRLGITNRMADTQPPTPERIEEVRARFAAAGFDPKVGT